MWQDLADDAWQQLRRVLTPNPGWYGLAAAVVLTVIGATAMADIQPVDAAKQAQRWLPIALVVMGLCALPHPRMIGMAAYPMMIGTMLLMVFIALPFAPRAIVPMINGARRWIDIQVMLVQPSEIAKIVFVLALARYLRYRDSYRTFRGLLVPFLILMVPVVLLLKQPDLGTALLFVPALFVMLVAAGAKLSHLSALTAIGVVVIGVNVSVIAFDAPPWMRLLKPHQEARIAAMLWPERHRDDSYQQRVAVMLAGAGGVTGLGPERSTTLLRFNHLPEDHNDMIFAVILNRWGLVGGIAVMALYLVQAVSFVLVAARSKDPFARLSCVGFTGVIFAQASINMGVTTGMLPITGMTLPFISYGGSSLVATFAIVGLVLNFAARRPAILSRPSFEFDRSSTAPQ